MEKLHYFYHKLYFCCVFPLSKLRADAYKFENPFNLTMTLPSFSYPCEWYNPGQVRPWKPALTQRHVNTKQERSLTSSLHFYCIASEGLREGTPFCSRLKSTPLRPQLSAGLVTFVCLSFNCLRNLPLSLIFCRTFLPSLPPSGFLLQAVSILFSLALLFTKSLCASGPMVRCLREGRAGGLLGCSRANAFLRPGYYQRLFSFTGNH